VIKGNLVPTGFAMTGIALTTVGAVVDVRRAMTGIATGWRIAISLIRMAGATAGLLMQPLEGECRFAMIKPGLPPTLAVVTILTGLPHGAGVAIIRLVTTKTVAGSLAKFPLLFMATTTTGGAVSPLQGEVGVVVIEAVPVQVDDISLAAKMFAVAGAAVAGRLGG